MRIWSCLLLVACNATPPAPAPAPAAAARRPQVAPAPPVTAAHSANITTLGVVADGGAAVTGDRLGGIRLWPALDGTREPVVIAGPAPHALALVRHADGFVIGVLDSAGGVQLVHTDAAGRVRESAPLAGESPVSELEAVGDGFLVLRTDQTLAYVDPRGTARGVLTPEPGTHITALVTRNAHVVALVQDGKRVHGRHVLIDDADHTAAWGDTTPPIEVPIKSAVLSPNGTLLAVQRPRNLHPVLVTLATGKVEKTQLCVERQWPSDDDGIDVQQVFTNDLTPLPLGFVSDTVVACTVLDRLVWWQTAGEQLSGTSMTISALPVVAGDARLVIASGNSLGFVDPSTTHFLGYGLHDIGRVRFATGGVLLDRNDQQQLVIGHDLRDRARVELGRSWIDALPIDDRFVLTLTRHDGTKVSPTVNHLAVFDTVAKAYRQMLPYAVHDALVSYEPKTRLAALASNDTGPAMLIAFDPATHLFGAPMPLEDGWTTVVPVDPALANGVVALALATPASGGAIAVGEIRASDVHPGAPIRPMTVWRAQGAVRTVDRAGRLYVAVGTDLIAYEHGQIAATLGGVAGDTVAPSYDGAHVVALRQQRIELFGRSGATLWETKQWGPSTVGWSGDDLVVQFVGGLAKLDLATGAITERRCGWAFGLTDQALETGQNVGSICDVAR